MLFNKDKSIFDKINNHLIKRGHELVMSLYLSNYNGNNIYVRFDYVRKLAVYKIVWVDLNYFNEKHIEDYLSIQLVTKYLSMKIVEHMVEAKQDSGYEFNDNIIGDRVEILTYFNNSPKEYIFDRFLPIEWDFLIDPLALIFSYLPRSMEVFLNEIFAKFDGLDEKYNYLKPVKFDLIGSELNELFKDKDITKGKKLFEAEKVKYLEKLEDKYFAVVEDKIPYLITLHMVDEEHSLLLCNCKKQTYCEHTCAVLYALRKKKFNNFYKVKYTGREETMLEKITISNFYMCFGIENDKLLLVTVEGSVYPADIVQHGKVVFEVIEDDDECSLSKQLKEYQKN